MLSKKIKYLILFFVISAECATIVNILIHIENKQLTAEPKFYEHMLRDEMRVYRPLPDLGNFFEPPANRTVEVPNNAYEDTSPTTYIFNSDSLNETQEYSEVKATSTYRIVALGDSFTFGVSLNTKDNYTEQLEKRLNNECTVYEKYEVINLAMAGYDIQYSLARFNLRGIKYSPDLVTWLITDDDFVTVENTLDSLFHEDFQKAIDAQHGAITPEIFNQSIQSAKKKFLSATDVPQNVKTSLQSLLAIRNLYSGSLILFSPPNTLTLQTNTEFPEFNSFFKSPNTYYINTIGNFSDPLYTQSETDRHPNKLGSELIAHDLFEYLVNNNIVPCT